MRAPGGVVLLLSLAALTSRAQNAATALARLSLMCPTP